MDLFNQQLCDATSSATQPTSFEKEALIKMDCYLRMVRALLNQFFKVFISLELLLDHLKAKNLRIKGRQKQISPRKGINTLIELSRFMMDHKMKRL